MNYRLNCLFLSIILVSHSCFSQIVYDTELGASLGANSQNPFWFHSNRYGELPTTSNFLIGKMGLYKEYTLDSTNKLKNKWIGWRAGLKGILNLSSKSNFNLLEAYVNARIWDIEIGAGRKKEFIGLFDPILSTGNYSYSTNTLPVPKWYLSSRGFIEVPFTTQMVAFKFNYSDGILGIAPTTSFTNYKILPETYIHQKSFYGRFGRPNWSIKSYGGFSHSVMWGGETIYTNNALNWDKWTLYKGVIQGVSWNQSRVGNHVANIDMGLSYENKRHIYTIYKQTPVEDGSLVDDFKNWIDGLYGINIFFKEKNTKKIAFNRTLLEIFYSYKQGGSIFLWDTQNRILGRDNYFNHYIYASGWSYKGRTLGTAVIAPQTLFRKELQDGTSGFTMNNRIAMLHVALQGTAYHKYDFMLKTSLSRNAGTYDQPINPQRWQFSGLLELKTKTKYWGGAEAVGMLATDLGGLYPNSLALYVGLRKTGVFGDKHSVKNEKSTVKKVR
jgi:Capsule assembly protein Wzi